MERKSGQFDEKDRRSAHDNESARDAANSRGRKKFRVADPEKRSGEGTSG